MNIVVIGLGSMGRRRIRLLFQYNSDMNIVGVDSNAERCKDAEKKYGIKTYPSIDSVFQNEVIDCVFVATSPLSHGEIISHCLKHNCHIFTEINLVNTLYKENMELAKEKNRILFLSSTFLYRKEIEYIKHQVEQCKCNVNYLYHTGQYLPDWHPWENYKDFFVGEKETNGCRELMAIEFPWIIDTFGEIEKVTIMSGNISKLVLNYQDNYMICFQHKNGNKGTIALDVVSRKPSRNLEIFGENLYLTWNGTPSGITQYDYYTKEEKLIHCYEEIEHHPEYCATIIEDAYYSEIEEFFKVIKKHKKSKYTFREDMDILALIDSIEQNNEIKENEIL